VRAQPVFFVATQQHVRVYHLAEQRLLKKLLTGCKHVSCMDVHPSGDHVLVGSYDRSLRSTVPHPTPIPTELSLGLS
jgi:ribosome biogenesis protein ERB1